MLIQIFSNHSSVAFLPQQHSMFLKSQIQFVFILVFQKLSLSFSSYKQALSPEAIIIDILLHFACRGQKDVISFKKPIQTSSLC